MRSSSRRFETRRARIELVPMIDTMVFLLVFFMIASLAMSKQKGFPVTLPKADSATPATWADRALVITAKADGTIYLNKTLVSRETLKEKLAASLKNNSEQVVVINADSDLLHRQVVGLMDEARLAGATHLAIATDGKEGLFQPGPGEAKTP
jgi:biopolymer transport protein ExbD